MCGHAEGSRVFKLWTQLLQKLSGGFLGQAGGEEREVQLSLLQGGVQSEACAEEEQHAG